MAKVIRLSSVVLFSLVLTIVLFTVPSCLEAQGFAEDWRRVHEKDLVKWSKKTGLSIRRLDDLMKVARHDGSEESDPDHDWYSVENLDTSTLRGRGHILLSTWDAGTGHCMTVYILERSGNEFRKLWQSTENLCTASVLGAATSQALPDGRIVIRFRDYSSDFDPEMEEHPRVLNIKLTYKWNGSSYVSAGRLERPEASANRHQAQLH